VGEFLDALLHPVGVELDDFVEISNRQHVVGAKGKFFIIFIETGINYISYD
jgi:hypothetical protein